MLKKFTVTNFKNFRNKTVFDLGSPANYEFNCEAIKEGIVSKGILYGINGCGKSNLALAIFDIVIHLTDKQKLLDKYQFYLNLDEEKKEADFEYIFSFDGVEVVYRYSKTSPVSLVYEALEINGREVIRYDFARKEGHVSLKGAETMRLSSTLDDHDNRLSRVKYIMSNALLEDTAENRVFKEFIAFVDRMLMFYSLKENGYQGFHLGVDSITAGIIREGKEKEFESFLRSEGVDYNLVKINVNGSEELYCKFAHETVPFTVIASTGTLSLALFYYWYIKMASASFVFIDEYDAFYHFALSQHLVACLKELKDVQILLSTHNTDLISNDILRPDAYFLINNGRIDSIDNLTSKELRRAHNIQKMFKAGSFNG